MPDGVGVERPKNRWEIVDFEQQRGRRQDDKQEALPDVTTFSSLQQTPEDPAGGPGHSSHDVGLHVVRIVKPAHAQVRKVIHEEDDASQAEQSLQVLGLPVDHPHYHAIQRSQHHRISKRVIEQLRDGKVPRVEHRRPDPRVQANVRKDLPQRVHRTVRPHFPPEPLQHVVVRSKVGHREHHRGRFLQPGQPHKRPFAVELRSRPVSLEKGARRSPHTIVAALIVAGPQEQLIDRILGAGQPERQSG